MAELSTAIIYFTIGFCICWLMRNWMASVREDKQLAERYRLLELQCKSGPQICRVPDRRHFIPLTVETCCDDLSWMHVTIHSHN